MSFLGVAVSVARVASPSAVEIEDVDAVVVHAGREVRFDVGLELVQSGAAPLLVLSDAGRSEYGGGEGSSERLCGHEEPFEVVCPAPEPPSTIGEARAFGRLIDQRGWKVVAVVTSRSHLTRAQLAVSQCTDAEVLPVAAEPNSISSVETVAKEWLAAGATATLWRACW